MTVQDVLDSDSDPSHAVISMASNDGTVLATVTISVQALKALSGVIED